MALMVVVGSMNLLWMVAITALISVEILARDGEQLAGESASSPASPGLD